MGKELADDDRQSLSPLDSGETHVEFEGLETNFLKAICVHSPPGQTREPQAHVPLCDAHF